MSTENWLQLCGVVIAASAALFAFVQAKAATDSRGDALAAQEAAEAARDEALELSRKATAAAVRQAAAQERANAIAEAAGPEFSLVRIGANFFKLINTGTCTLLDAELIGVGGGDFEAVDLYPMDIGPGESTKFKAAWAAVGGSVEVTLSGQWLDDGVRRTHVEPHTFDMNTWG